MTRYYVGDRLILGKCDEKPIAAGRVDVLRPDGSTVRRDWGPGPWRLKLDQAGHWTWRLYIREETRTCVEEGDIMVLPAPKTRRGPGWFLQQMMRVTHSRRR
jgi:hypothetical protein